ncbi:hypothetical protein [Desulfitobacterium hafniense]|uniref:hypothetical protein n=1 Tax=Desulfitobacterium hafniense TaxID=49338 RepID=UPI00030B7FE2|nr:hypothetical protein [Desulfitobacterium hafniense]
MITIDTSQVQVQLDWSAKGSKRKAQNVLNLINTWRYDVAYNRVMGLNPDILEKPFPIASALYVADIYRLIHEYQPDVTVKDVQIKSIDPNGNIEAVVVIEV